MTAKGPEGSALSRETVQPSLLVGAMPDSPLSRSATPAAALPLGHTEKKVREVLVVDDLPEIGDFFKALIRRLREFDIHLCTEVNSARALEMVRSRPFDLVVSDFRMRQVDGVEVLRAAYEKNPRGCRILMTGYNEIPTSMERIREAYIDAYIQKPLKSQDLLLLIFDFLSGNKEAIEASRRYAREMEAMGAREEAHGSLP